MPNSQPVSLLIVDDHIENLLALEATLAGEGYRLVRAQSGDEALRHLLREDFAVIVLDVQMPGMDGFETARLIKARDRTKDTPILFISATSKEAVHQFEGYSAGAIDYLVKPITSSIVKAKIAAFVRLYQSNRELENKQVELRKQKAELEALNGELLRVTYELTTEEAKSRMIFDTSIDGMFTFDEEGVILSVNPAMERLFGYPAEEMVGANAQKVLPDLPGMRRPGADGDSNIRYLTGLVSEMRAMRSNGCAFEAEIQLGESVINLQRLFACTVRDITERKRTLRQLTDAKNEAERASRAKSEFLAMISHEIRTPLNGVIGMSELLTEASLPEEQSKLSQAVRSNAGRLLGIMNDILEFSRLDAGKQELDSQPFSVEETIAQVIAEFKPAAARKGLAFTCEIRSGVPGCVVGDPLKYREIVRRLVDNAIKFTDTGSVDIVVQAERSGRAEEADIRLSTSIADTGIGIPEDKKDLLFLPFSQLDSSLARRFEGLGMGLAMCQALAKAMDGVIRLEAKEGPGAKFVCVVGVAPFDWSPPSIYSELPLTREYGEEYEEDAASP